MPDRYEASSEIARRMHPTSHMEEAQLELAVHSPPAPAAAALPENYGVARFEVLVVDPEWAFVVWELPQGRNETLQLRFYAAGQAAPALAGFNLYGASGRWFVHAALPGKRVEAALGYATGPQFDEQLRRGPLCFPRNFVLDAGQFEELHVEYERGPGGQLLLRSLNPQAPQPWPERLSELAWPSQPLDWLDGAAGLPSLPPGSSAQGGRRGRGPGSSPGSSGVHPRGGQADV